MERTRPSAADTEHGSACRTGNASDQPLQADQTTSESKSNIDPFWQALRSVVSWVIGGNLGPFLGYASTCLALGTIHFAFFVDNFDIRMLAIVDASAIARYFLTMTLTLVVALAVSRFIFHFFGAVFSHSAAQLQNDSDIVSRVVSGIALTMKIVEGPYLFGLLLFVLFFARIYSLKYLVLLMVLVLTAGVLDNIRPAQRFVARRRLSSIYRLPILLCRKPRRRLYGSFRPGRPLSTVLLIALVALLANARAAFVKNENLVCIVANEHKNPVGPCITSIFLSSDNGVFVWDKERTIAYFIPWDAGIRVEASGEARRFLGRAGFLD